MIEIRAITPVSACFELRNDAPYYAPQSYTICLNGEMVRSGDTNVFSVFSLRPGADAVDYLLRACELCAETLAVDPAQVYTFDEFRDAIARNLPLEHAQSMLGSLLGGHIGVLFAPPQPDRRVVLACLTLLLRREGSFSALAMHTLAAFPRELLCALTLKEIL